MRKYELVVVGGGFAGVAAAIAAARAGVDVLLVDKGNCLGGAAVNCLVSPFMPYSTVIDGEHVVLSAGIFSEIIRRMDERHAMVGERFFLEEELKFVLNDMVLEAGVKLLFHAYIFKAEKRDGRITSISVATKSGETRIEADDAVELLVQDAHVGLDLLAGLGIQLLDVEGVALGHLILLAAGLNDCVHFSTSFIKSRYSGVPPVRERIWAQL